MLFLRIAFCFCYCCCDNGCWSTGLCIVLSLSLSVVKHIAIMTLVPEMPETSVRFFPVIALLFNDLMHRFVEKCSRLDSTLVFHKIGTIIYKP